jgi:hypothetical protein
MVSFYLMIQKKLHDILQIRPPKYFFQGPPLTGITRITHSGLIQIQQDCHGEKLNSFFQIP